MLKTIKVLAMSLFVLFLYSQPAMSREFADIFSDCGIGAMIAPRNQGVAAATNITWDSGTTAVSSNITSPDTCQGGKEKTAAFIHDAYASLENDLATGQGAYLDTLTTLVGRDAQGRQEFIEGLRNDFAKVVADPNYTNKSRFEKAQTLYNLVYRHVDGTSAASFVNNS